MPVFSAVKLKEVKVLRRASLEIDEQSFLVCIALHIGP